MNTRNDAPTASLARFPRRAPFGGLDALRGVALLGTIGALLGSALLAACDGNTGAQVPNTLPPATSGPIVSTSVNIPSNGPLTALTPATTAPAATSASGAVPTITQADNGTTINLAARRQVFLALNSSYDWSIMVEDETVLAPMVGVALPSGVQGVYMAGQPGQTTLTAIGEPQCRKAQPPCDAPTVRFRVQIAVA
jgi:hypothetical protein